MSRWLIAVVVLAAIAGAAASEPPDPLSWLAALDKPQLDKAAAIQVKDQVIRIGPALLRLERGVIVPTVRVAGYVEEAVFIGTGRLQFDPPDPIERGQLELFAYKKRLDEPFEQLVLGGAGLKLEEIFVAGAVPASRVPPSAAEVLLAWKEGVARGPRQLPEAMLQARLDVAHAGAFSFATLETKEEGKLLLQVDPNEESPFSLMHYKPRDLTEFEQRQIWHSLRRDQRAGRTRDLDLARLATWDTWCAATLDEDRTGGSPFVGKSYSIDMTVEPEGEKVHGTSAMHIVARGAGGRVVHLGMHGNLRLSSLRDPSGSLIPFRQFLSSAWAYLPTPIAAGAELTLKAEFAGTLFEKTRSKEFRTGQTLLWHPHVDAGTADRVEMEITVRFSPPIDVRVGGKRVGQGGEGGQKWVKHVSPGVAPGIFVEVGQFEDVTDTNGEHAITVSFSKQNQRWMSKEKRDLFVAEARQILEWMEREVGPYPYGQLSIVIVDQDFGQSLPGTVIFPDVVLASGDLTLRYQVFDWRVMLAHEVAHQWWGNRVIWASQRDAWLSEAMAEYLSQLYGRRSLLKKHEGDYVSATKNWRRELEAPSGWGRPVESVGPIVLSDRLNSSNCRGCYDSIVYRKGALALESLGQYIGEDRFLKMLQEIVKRSRGVALSGKTFLSMIAKLADTDVRWFERRYLEGTGFPLVSYTYRVEPASSGGWDVFLHLSQSPRFLYAQKLQKLSDGRLVVANIPIPRVEIGPEPLPIPFAFRVFDPGKPEIQLDPGVKPTWRNRANWRLRGRVILEGETKIVKVHSEFEVVEVLLDPNVSVLAEIICETCNPKWAIRRAALRELQAGHLEEAEALVAQGLVAEVDGYPLPTVGWQKVERRHAAASEDAALLFVRSEIFLARNDLAAAMQAVDEGAALITGDAAKWISYWRDIQRSRVYLGRGEDRKAYLLLWNLMANSEAQSTEALLLMAIAADRTNETDAYVKAMRRAKGRHVDVSLLEARRALPPDDPTNKKGGDEQDEDSLIGDEPEYENDGSPD
ncbi:MAG: M1 family aminopeptidase [Acidobacteriota bacterium]